ncbi:MAG: hypothetical protein IJ867_01730 [Clostridia bacterium]|nr:hypothetical protein [Clostridia bacterium]
MKNNKGITLVSLVASVILIVILAATTIVTSMNAYNQMKFEGAKAELEEMQKLVEEIATDYASYSAKTADSTYAKYFSAKYGVTASNPLSGGAFSSVKTDSKFKSLMASSEWTKNYVADNEANYYFYFTADDLVKFFGLKGIDDVVVDFAKRLAYSVEGIKDSNNDNKIYYCPTEWGAVKEKNTTKTATGSVSYASATSATVNKVKYYNVKLALSSNFTGTVSEVLYKKSSASNWLSSSDVHLVVESNITYVVFTIKWSEAGTYDFKVIDERGLEYIVTSTSALN